MRDCSVEAPACMPTDQGRAVDHWHDTGDCGTGAGAYLFFFGFFIMVFCVFLNLFVAIVLDTFIMFQSTSKDSSEDNQGLSINEDDFNTFKDNWVGLDPDSTGYISR
jgi:hypothetical protein